MALAAGTSIRALDGFFRLHYSCEVPAPTPVVPTPHLFSSFVLDTNSWEELEKKRQLLETSSSTSEHASEGSHVKIVYFVRHAEGYHNVAERELGTARWEAVEAKQEKFLDADLTPFGINDAQSKGPPAVAVELAKGMPPVERVIVSPMSRAIQTAENFFTPGQGPRPFVAMELCRETLGIHTCDKRRPLHQIKEKFAGVDFSRITDEEDVMWQPNNRETDDELRARAKEFLVQLFDEVEERHVAVVTHSGFMSSVWSLFYGEPFKAANCERHFESFLVMGDILSRKAPVESKSVAARTGKGSGDAPAAASEAIFLDEIDPESAEWSREGMCTTIQRFLGLLPDSKGELLKQDQKIPLYVARVPVGLSSQMTSASRAKAILIVQRVYRRYRLLVKWHVVAFQMLDTARVRIEEREMQEKEQEMVANFRELLMDGFSAQKVSVSGTLKSIHLLLVFKPEQEDCYLTWTPSRKRQARINLHDIAEVVPVLKEGNKHAPKLANKVSHRRGLIIVCKSHHRGRVILQMETKQARKVMLAGFKRLLADLNDFNPTLDSAGALRKSMPRRQSVVKFFAQPVSRKDPLESASSDEEDLIPVDHQVDTPNESKSSESTGTKDQPPPSEEPKKVKRRSTFSRFYKTRFDEPTEEDVASKSTLTRRSSMVVK
ncbi:hypothetical protein Poli38472_008973 [Pythium oligandrum]|uniref:Phosphoglycerate mutase n=1 Tax=Pythium oligandrum TaxID=41045 RepID=A0A8K1CJK7_PYTOL|nr:hypothetical protein Poli38472_008973 [Pythium oligandrum]|eukprot:TMW64806.1 hypothetical protein Poli38472_008973 [Pythium oligandrum]